MRHNIKELFEKEYVGGTSSFIAFVRAIKGKGYDRRLISKWFNTLVEKDDYASKDREQIIVWLCQK